MINWGVLTLTTLRHVRLISRPYDPMQVKKYHLIFRWCMFEDPLYFMRTPSFFTLNLRVPFCWVLFENQMIIEFTIVNYHADIIFQKEIITNVTRLSKYVVIDVSKKTWSGQISPSVLYLDFFMSIRFDNNIMVNSTCFVQIYGGCWLLTARVYSPSWLSSNQLHWIRNIWKRGSRSSRGWRRRRRQWERQRWGECSDSDGGSSGKWSIGRFSHPKSHSWWYSSNGWCDVCVVDVNDGKRNNLQFT